MGKAMVLFFFLLVLAVYRAVRSAKRVGKTEQETRMMLSGVRPCADYATETLVDRRGVEDVDHKLATWVSGNADMYLSDPDDVERVETWQRRAKLLHFRYRDGNMRDPFALKISRDLEREREFRKAS